MSKSDDLAIARSQTSNRGCFVNGLRVMHGHKISHSNIKTNRLFKQNLSNKNVFSELLGHQKIKISTRGQRTIEKYGGLDLFLTNYKKRKMTYGALKMRKLLLKTKVATTKTEVSV